MQKLLGWSFSVLAFLVLAAAGWWLVTPDAEVAADPGAREFVLPVTLAPVARGTVQPRVSLSGSIRSAQRAELGFEIPGRLVELAVEEGATVEKGAVLARQSRRDEELELASAKAAQVLAERELQLLEAGERGEEIRRLEAQLEAALAESQLAALEVDRGQKLLEDRVISQSEQDRRVTANRAADRRRAAAEELLAKARAGTREEDLAISQARLEAARTRVDTAEYELEKTELRAPWNGVVVRRFASIGDLVAAGTPVYELVDLEHLEVHVEIPGRYAPVLQENAPVRITLPQDSSVAIDTRLDVTIPTADERARSFRGIVRLGPSRSDYDRLRPGMFARVELLLKPALDSLTLPSDAIQVGDGNRYVVRAKEGATGTVAELVPVEVVAQDGGFAAVRASAGGPGEPLHEGDQVVLSGAARAFPGAALLVRDEEGGR